MIREFGAVCLVLAMVIGLAYWARGRSANLAISRWNGGKSKRLQVIQRLPLSPQHLLCMVSVDGKEWLLSLHPHGVEVLKREQDT